MNSPIIFEEEDTEYWNGTASIMKNYFGPKNDWLALSEACWQEVQISLRIVIAAMHSSGCLQGAGVI